MNSHHELNHMPPYVLGDHPLKLWPDYGCEHRGNSGTAAFCSVVVGHKGVQRWLYEDELSQYADAHRQDKDAEGYGVPAIDNAIAIFGKDEVRAWTGGG